MENDIKLHLAKRIRQLRKEHGYTQQELAEKAGIDYKHIQRLEGKKPPAARLDTLEKIANALGVKIEKLMSS